jgi:chromosome partitioning protein
MKTISVVAKKGGVGKTALATNIAAVAAGDGLSVAIVDLDPQASACVWADVRDNDSSVPAVPVTSIAPARLPSALEKCRAANIELVIIDTAPSADSGLLAAAKAGDLCLLPTKPGLADLSALADTVELLKSSKANSATLLNMVATKALKLEGNRALEGLGLPVVPVAIWQRVAWGHAFSGGWGVIEFEPTGKAAVEMSQLWKWIKGELGYGN